MLIIWNSTQLGVVIINHDDDVDHSNIIISIGEAASVQYLKTIYPPEISSENQRVARDASGSITSNEKKIVLY